MNLSFAYLDSLTKTIWLLAGVTDVSVLLRKSGCSGIRYIPRDEFTLMTYTGKLVPA
jgi:hypothetical protein